MPKLPGVNHVQAVRALERLGFRIRRQGKHIIMSDGVRIVVVPRSNPINAFTMGRIVQDNWNDDRGVQEAPLAASERL